ncbi:MAG TPA: hypothetical protein VK992_01830 [Candidatus Caenarcaniphilales bacterium]|nr:hypothetical protein [Candidatus Caenarcaniphilales bacterium]
MESATVRHLRQGADGVRAAGRGAAVALAFAGVAIVLGSLMTWEWCPYAPCGGEGLVFPVFVDRSGIDVAAGVLTAEIGLLLGLAGIAAFRRGGMLSWRREASALAVLPPLILTTYVVWVHVLPHFGVSVGYGVYVVAGGSAVAAVAWRRLRPGDDASIASARARRVPFALLIAATALWSLAVLRHFPMRLEPLIYSVVLGALGVGMWPGRLRPRRLEAPLVGVGILLYGAFALVAIVAGASSLLLLEAAPLAVFVGLAASHVRWQLPPLDPPLLRGRLERTAARARLAMRSTSTLLFGALLLISVALLLSGMRAVAGFEVGRLSWIDPLPTATPTSLAMLVAGLAIGVAIAARLARARSA